jgi:hypothetical protein
MNPAWTELDKRATLIARSEYLRRDPTEREPFENYVKKAYQYVRASQYPGEYLNPFAETGTVH